MIRRIASGGVYEPRIGYCRAVVAGGFIHVSGTVAGPDVSDDVVAQCQSALGIMERALAEAGASFADALRVRYILPNLADFEPCWPVLSAAFGDNPPAATMISADLIDPKYKIEIELTALDPNA
ncbi:MAG: RidA family protein [Yoonia sp.]|jgi:enamine deaminase RidA (YjgF/YER057c/UK114 family)|nr:RidA family protein [Yoonia sp.]MDG1868669.1 RidA family protein [Yoonia sp.]